MNKPWPPPSVQSGSSPLSFPTLEKHPALGEGAARPFTLYQIPLWGSRLEAEQNGVAPAALEKTVSKMCLERQGDGGGRRSDWRTYGGNRMIIVTEATQGCRDEDGGLGTAEQETE